jgi:hypothetical protein
MVTQRPRGDCCEIDTTGNSDMAAMRKLPVVLLCRTSSVLQKSANQKYIPPQPASPTGTFGQSLPNVRRVAMDAVDAQGRSARDAFDKTAWSRHPDAGVKPAR